MKTYHITLGGNSLELKYRLEDREVIEDMFERSGGNPGSMGTLIADHLVKNGGAFRPQVSLIWAGLRHLGDAWPLVKVREEYGKVMMAGTEKSKEEIRAIKAEAFKAILASGILGIAIEDDEEGKAPAPAA